MTEVLFIKSIPSAGISILIRWTIINTSLYPGKECNIEQCGNIVIHDISRATTCLSDIQSLCTAKSFEMAVFESQKARINSDMLSRYISRPICFVGRVEKVHPTGNSFSLSDGDGSAASVELNEPLDEELSGVVEVLGMVSNKGTIMASAYNILREDKGIPFDLELYNEVLKVIHDFPQHYPFGIATSG